MEEYALKRKEYVQQVRASFDENGDFTKEAEKESGESEISPFFFTKLRVICSIFLFFVFLFCKYNSCEIFTKTPEEVIDMISNNQYYTFLQNYDIFMKAEFNK